MTPDQELFEAVLQRDRAAVENHLARGAMVDSRHTHGQGVDIWLEVTPLMMAAAAGDVGLMELLVSRGADLHAQAKFWERSENQSRTPLDYAIIQGRTDAVRYLLAQGAKPNRKAGGGATPLMEAIEADQPDILLLLLEAGAKISKGNLDGTPLLSAIHGNSLIPVEILLDHGADPNQLSRFIGSPLQAAVQQRNLAVMELLLQRGAKFDLEDDNGNTPLLRSLSPAESRAYEINTKADLDAWAEGTLKSVRGPLDTPKVEIVNALIKAGANPNHRNRWGWSPLMVALKYRYADIEQVLLAAGADSSVISAFNLIRAVENGRPSDEVRELAALSPAVNLYNEHGDPILAVAYRMRGITRVRALLERGADPNFGANIAKEPVFKTAIQRGDRETIQCLIAAGQSSEVTDDRGKGWMAWARGTKGMVDFIRECFEQQVGSKTT